jgi:hypothetical protein
MRFSEFSVSGNSKISDSVPLMPADGLNFLFSSLDFPEKKSSREAL